MNEISFSPVEIGVITALLTAMATPLAVLFLALRTSYLDRIGDAREALIESRRRNDDLRPSIEKLTESVREQSVLIRQLLDRREAMR